jgi:hypothetical protein
VGEIRVERRWRDVANASARVNRHIAAQRLGDDPSSSFLSPAFRFPSEVAMIHRLAAPVLLACALVVPLSGASARRDIMVEYTCPIDGQKFMWRTPMSGTSFGSRLDGRRIGPIAVPYPYPVCPGNGFVLYRDSSKLDADYIARAKALVVTEEYRRVRDAESSHFLAAFVAERLGENPSRVADLARQAAWEAEDRRDRTDRHQRYLRLAADKLRLWQESIATRDTDWAYREVIRSELLRQAGAFNEARQTLAAMPPPMLAELTKNEQVKEKIDRLRELIEAEDTKPL